MVDTGFVIHRALHLTWGIALILIMTAKTVKERSVKKCSRIHRIINRTWILIGFVEVIQAVDEHSVFGIYPSHLWVAMDNVASFLIYITISEVVYITIDSAYKCAMQVVPKTQFKIFKFTLRFVIIFSQLFFNILGRIIIGKMVIVGIGFVIEILIVLTVSVGFLYYMQQVVKMVVSITSVENLKIAALIKKQQRIFAVISVIALAVFFVLMIEAFSSPDAPDPIMPDPDEFSFDYVQLPLIRFLVEVAVIWKFSIPFKLKSEGTSTRFGTGLSGVSKSDVPAATSPKRRGSDISYV